MPDTASLAGRRRVLVTGATGFIGRHVVAALEARGDVVVAWSRRPERVAALCGAAVEAVAHLEQLPATLPLDAIVNLAGAPILGPPWTTGRRALLRESRIDTTRAVVALCARLATPPRVLVSASAIGYYGPRGAETLDEASPPQRVFQSELCDAWEHSAAAATALGVRVVPLRFGVVLGTDGGALPLLARPVRLGLGTILGSGRQGAPWIHIADATRLVLFALDTPTLQGPVNAVAPATPSHREFQEALGTVLHRPIWLHIPALLLRAALGEMAQLLVDGQFIVPSRALAAGFTFQHPRLIDALSNLLTPQPQR